MKLYSAKVRLGGSLEHEVNRDNLTGAEMHLLAKIHEGKHPVLVDIKHTGDVNRTDAKERARLADTYTKGELTEDRGVKLINELFGVAGVPLPQDYVAPTAQEPVEFGADAEGDEPEVITPVAPIARSGKAKATTNPKAADAESLAG